MMRSAFIVPLLCLSLACAGTDEARTSGGDGNARAGTSGGMNLAVDADGIGTVQLHARGDETSLPVARLGSNGSLRLAFDLVESNGRPLSVWFYHADRTWRRDLFPAEYMGRFQNDSILDYRPSNGTLVPYMHYEYAFPNNAIEFTISGNYVVRVTEQGLEDDVLFERAFFMTEDEVTVDMRLDNVLLIGAPFQGVQPFISFRPEDPAVSPFDYSVCFVRNHLFEASRCADGPSLAQNPTLLFYLEQSDAFVPTDPTFYLHLGDIRTGGRIERVSQSQTPWRVWLEPDQARFPGSYPAPFLNGQAVLQRSVPGVAEPAFGAEYVDVTFRFIPIDSVPAQGGVFLRGTFSGWHPTEPMEWNAEEGWYELTVPVKQGQHEYVYASPDPRLQRALSTGQSQFQNRYTTFVYLDDIRRQTDRLLAVKGTVLP